MEVSTSPQLTAEAVLAERVNTHTMTGQLLPPTPLWRLQLLGQLRAVRGEEIITRFRRHKDGALLAYLAYFVGRLHPREALIEQLWPECDPVAGRDQLSTSLSSLRRQLEPPGVAAGSVLAADRAVVGLRPAVVSTDVAEFEARLAAAAGARSRLESLQSLAEAVERYGGELLPGYFEAWIPAERHRLLEAYLQALGQLVQQRERERNLPRALEYARQRVEADPLREEGPPEPLPATGSEGQRGRPSAT